MKNYLVKMRLRVNGGVYKAGDTVELSDTQATPLLNMKAVTLAPIAEPVTPIKSVMPATEVTLESATPVTAHEAMPTPTVEPVSSEPIANVAPMEAETTQNAEPVATPSETQTSTANAYSNFTKAQLNAELDKRGIAHDSKATNEVLESLLVADDSKAK